LEPTAFCQPPVILSIGSKRKFMRGDLWRKSGQTNRDTSIGCSSASHSL
jgi:hypothetical protein